MVAGLGMDTVVFHLLVENMEAVEAGGTLVQMELSAGVESNQRQMVALCMEPKGTLGLKMSLLSEAGSILVPSLQVGPVGIQELEVIYREMWVGCLAERR